MPNPDPPFCNGERNMETVSPAKLKFVKLSSLAVVASWFLVAVPTAVAEETGSFTMLHSYERNYTVIEHAGGQVTGGSLTGTSTVLRSSGAPFVKGSVSTANCIVFVRMTEAGIDLEAPCTTTDADGDSLFFVSRRTAGDIQEGGGGAGHAEIVGGTGRYAGISGSCSYDTAYLPNGHTVTFPECDWKR